MEKELEHIVRHIQVLNHSSERMTADLSRLTSRVSSIEAHLSWVVKLVILIATGVVTLVFKVFTS